MINNQGAEIFSLQNEEVKCKSNNFYDEYEHLFTLKINDVSIVSNQDYETEAFIKNYLQNALTTKLNAQMEEERMQSAIKNMSAQDIMIKKHLEKMLQR